MLNFIAVILCTAAAIWQGYFGSISRVLILSALGLINLPFAIEWLMDWFD